MTLEPKERAAILEVWEANQTGDMSIFRAPANVLEALDTKGLLHKWQGKNGG